VAGDSKPFRSLDETFVERAIGTVKKHEPANISNPGCTCARVTLRVTLEVVIQAFADKDTEKLFNGRRVRKYSSELSDRALQKLLMLNAANQISDLRMPPGNRLEALVGDRKGQHSIRINDQYRICFVWTAAGPRDVQIVDYH